MDLLNALFVIGAVILGWLLQYLFPGRDARRLAEAQERLATIEQARAEWEEKYRRLVGFTPRTQIVEYGPSSQSIIINANEEFEAFQLDYLLDDGVCVVSQNLDSHRGREAQIPLISAHVGRVQGMRYDPNSGVAHIRLRVRVRVLDAEHEVLIPARIENVLVGNAVHRKVIG